jgi:hypothetical protein
MDLSAARAAATALDAKIRPFATREIHDLSDLQQAMRDPSPLDELGIRAEAEALMASILHAYNVGDSTCRASIRQVLAEAPSFAWATGVPFPPTAVEGFRQRLLRISAIDRGMDPRDALTEVHELCAQAKSAGIDTSSVLRDVAALSSNVTHMNTWSIRSILLRAC